MVITCPNCQTKFMVPSQALVPDGRKVRCSRCAHVWFQGPHEEEGKKKPSDLAEFEYPEAPALAHKESNLPALVKEKGIPSWLIPAAAGAFALSIPFFLLGNRESWGAGMSGIYDMLGYYDQEGLALGDIRVLEFSNRRNRDSVTYQVNGKIINESEATRRPPVIRVTLMDEEGGELESLDIPQEEGIAPGAATAFTAQLKTRKTNVASVRLDIGSPLALSLR